MLALITRLLTLSALILSVVAAPMPQEDSKSIPDKAFITGISFAGSGCKAGTVSGMIEPDFTSITLLFSEYSASVGPGIPFKDSRKNCNVIVGFQYSPGWTYSILSTEYNGYVKLDKKVTALQKSEYGFDNQKKLPFQSTWTGVFDDDYNFTDRIEQGIWSPCKPTSSNLYINTQIRVENSKNPTGRGLISTDSITQRITEKYYVRWRRC